MSSEQSDSRNAAEGVLALSNVRGEARVAVKRLTVELVEMVDWAEQADDPLKTRIALNTKAGQLASAVKNYGRWL